MTVESNNIKTQGVTRCFHTRLRVTPEQASALAAAGRLYGRALGMALAGIARDELPGKPDGGGTARIDRALGLGSVYADSAWARADGLVKTTRAGYRRAIKMLDDRARAADKKAELLTAKLPRSRNKPHVRLQIHHARRRAQTARDRAAAKRARLDAGDIGICLGGARRAAQRPAVVADKIARTEARQARIGRRGTIRVAQTYATHDQWLTDWQGARGGEIFAAGSAAAVSGNAMIIITENDDGCFDLTVKVPPSLRKQHGATLVFRAVQFPYGADVIRGALDRGGVARAENERCKRLGGKRAMRARGDIVHAVSGASIAWRIKCVEGAWYAYAAVGSEHDITDEQPGALGVDYNDGFLSVADIGGDGNATRRGLSRIEMPNHGGTYAQRLDAMRKGVRKLVDLAIARGKPIVIEKMEFATKKAALRDLGSPRYARMLSALAYSKFAAHLETTARRAGIRVISVNPAFTSIMGRVRYAQLLGCDVHQSAAVEIGRRGMRCSERASPYAGRMLVVPGVRGHVAFQAPDRMPEKHVWSWWGRCLGGYRRAHEAQFSRRSNPPRSALDNSPAVAASLADDRAFLSGLIEDSVTPVTVEAATVRPPVLAGS